MEENTVVWEIKLSYCNFDAEALFLYCATRGFSLAGHLLGALGLVQGQPSLIFFFPNCLYKMKICNSRCVGYRGLYAWNMNVMVSILLHNSLIYAFIMMWKYLPSILSSWEDGRDVLPNCTCTSEIPEIFTYFLYPQV